MTWTERIIEAAYTSPGGTRKVFLYEDVSRTVDKNAAAFNFPDVNGTYIQDLGRSGRQFPLKVIFSGPDCDLDAAEFEDLLLETGTGRLEHPIYGVYDVVPFGTISRRDDLKTAANQAIIQVSFWENSGTIFPSEQSDPKNDTLTAINELNEDSANEFGDKVGVDTAGERIFLKNTVLGAVDKIKAGIQSVADAEKAVSDKFNLVSDSITTGIDELVGRPVTLAFQIEQLIQASARAAAGIQDRLSAYADLITGATSDPILTSSVINKNSANELFTRDFINTTYVSGSVLSAVNNRFTTKSAALSAADEILNQFDEVVAWRDENFTNLEEIDTGEAYQKLQSAVATAAGFLVEISFTLKQEKSVVLDRDRNMIELVAELYGEVDEQLDFFINSNQLTGSEILEIPAGREVVYYV